MFYRKTLLVTIVVHSNGDKLGIQVKRKCRALSGAEQAEQWRSGWRPGTRRVKGAISVSVGRMDPVLPWEPQLLRVIYLLC